MASQSIKQGVEAQKMRTLLISQLHPGGWSTPQTSETQPSQPGPSLSPHGSAEYRRGPAGHSNSSAQAEDFSDHASYLLFRNTMQRSKWPKKARASLLDFQGTAASHRATLGMPPSCLQLSCKQGDLEPAKHRSVPTINTWWPPHSSYTKQCTRRPGQEHLRV